MKNIICTIVGHLFEPRYSGSRPVFSASMYGVVHVSPEALAALKEQKYLGDICTRCGLRKDA